MLVSTFTAFIRQELPLFGVMVQMGTHNTHLKGAVSLSEISEAVSEYTPCGSGAWFDTDDLEEL